jgi:site-specific recombinase XerD
MSDSLRALKYSHKTSIRYMAIVDRYARFLEIPLIESGTQDATRFLACLERDFNASASTINQAISALRFLYTKVLGREAPLRRRPKSDRRLPGVLSREEAVRIVNAPRNLKHRLLLILAYSAGLRVSEIAALRVSDMDSARGVILVRSGKGRKDRYTILALGLKASWKPTSTSINPKHGSSKAKKGVISARARYRKSLPELKIKLE